MAPTFERFQGAILVGSCAGRLGFQLIEGLVKVQEELKATAERTERGLDAARAALKNMTVDHVFPHEPRKSARRRWPALGWRSATSLILSYTKSYRLLATSSN